MFSGKSVIKWRQS